MRDDYDERDLKVGEPKEWAAGVPGVAVALKRSYEHMGLVRTAETLRELNQTEGFDCMSCAWPDPDPGHRKIAEFCENGAKPWRRKPPVTAPTHPSSPGTASPISRITANCGWGSRDASRIR